MNRTPRQKTKKTKIYRCDSYCYLYVPDQFDRCEFTEEEDYDINNSPVRYLCPLTKTEPTWKLVKGGEKSE